MNAELHPEGILVFGDMKATEPTHADIAAFLRFGLLTGFYDVSAVVNWAYDIAASEPDPHLAFLELCLSGSEPRSTVLSLLTHVPGAVTPDLAVHMLLGHACRLLKSRAVPAEQILLRVYGVASLNTFPDAIYFKLMGLEDDYSLVRDGIHGTLAEVADDIATFLADYESYAPDIPNENT